MPVVVEPTARCLKRKCASACSPRKAVPPCQAAPCLLRPSCSAVPPCCAGCPRLPGFSFYSRQEIRGTNLVNLQGGRCAVKGVACDRAWLAKWCGSLPECKAFSTAGYLKSASQPRTASATLSSCSGVYVKTATGEPHSECVPRREVAHGRVAQLVWAGGRVGTAPDSEPVGCTRPPLC